ncbi:MAG: hypothetical protein VX963_06585 [Actinomycetota bacterium]|nr:hypothetical protein [Actinomycetota bacterium]
MALHGYWILTSNHRLFHFADEVSEVEVGLPSHPISLAMTRDGQGCLVLGSGGHVQAHGTARALGDLAGLDLVAPPVDIAASPTGVGYWVVDSEGSVFSFGNAPFLEGIPQVARSSTQAVRIEPTADGNGYWIVDNRGGVHCFGSAPFHGSLAGSAELDGLRVVDFAGGSGDEGYLFLDSDGRVHAVGDVAHFGSPTGLGRINAVGLISRPGGYLVADSRGALVAFGDAANFGSTVGSGLGVLAVA